MRPVVTVHTYKPRQVIFVKENQRIVSRNGASRSPNYLKLFLLVVATLSVGYGTTHALHCRVVTLQSRIDALKTSNAGIVDENQRLMATDAQLGSKTMVIALLAKRKLRLLEPVQGQVQRVQMKI
jgi:hypothetical protein